MSDDTVEQDAQRIAERGRDALVARLRGAFEEAAVAHSDVIQLDSDRLEAMVQNAADNADGLQWRRALASVASEELGISLAEALGHPVVARAQAIAGAPSYEESLAAIGSDGPATAAGDGPAMTSEPEPAPEPAEHDAVVFEPVEPEEARSRARSRRRHARARSRKSRA